MHTFQPYPIEMLECNPFTMIGKNWAALSAGSQKKANAMTVSWGGLGVLWGKNVCYVFVRDSRYTKEFMDLCGSFSLTFFPENFNKSPLMYIGTASGAHEDKLQKAGLNLNFSEGTPFIDEGNLVILCQKLSAMRITPDTFIDPIIEQKYYQNGDMHTMYVGEILGVFAR